MKIVTFNIRTSDADSTFDGANSFCYRESMIRDEIAKEQPDILCFQETRPYQADWAMDNVPGMMFLGCGRDTTLAKDESMLVGLRNGAFRVIAMDTFWLSPTPEVPGSRYEDQSDCPRCATELLVQYKKTGQLYRILNTHLDHISSSARVLGATALMDHLKVSAERLKHFGSFKTLVFGDFNAEPGDPEIDYMTADGTLKDITNDVGFTFHGYDPATHHTKIDYIFTSPDVEVSSVRKWTREEDGLFLSDHYPISAVIDE